MRVGELTGDLDQTLRSIADLYKQAAERAITALLKRLTNRFSPNPQAVRHRGHRL